MEEYLTFEKFKEVHPLARGLENEKDLRIAYISEYITFLKKQLRDTDYEAIKYAEGWLTEEEYTPIKASREKMRIKIRELEKEFEGE